MTRRFDSRGNYVDPTDPIGRQLDTLMAKRGIHGITTPPTATLLRGTMSEALLRGRPEDTVMMPRGIVGTTVEGLRRVLRGEFQLTPEQFAKLSTRKQDRILDKIDRLMEKSMRSQHPEVTMSNSSQWAQISLDRDESQSARSRLHKSLCEWANGPLTLERPQGASLHHMVQYDLDNTEGNFAQSLIHNPNIQSFVVEHDWARATAGTGLDEIVGEWRTPFAECCWEFRISGVRVLAFTHVEDAGTISFWMVYGRDGHWVMDDYLYDIVEGRLINGRPLFERDTTEFPRVARLVFDNVRVACILIDANVAEREHVAAPVALNKMRQKQKKTPLRDHFVVRLLDRKHRVRTARSAGAGSGGARAPQRGHWRRGTYVHFDDQDSGREQYANNGGFIVSRTWRPWHFAGDPNNLITKEYRL
jgi:hypothetical protein